MTRPEQRDARKEEGRTSSPVLCSKCNQLMIIIQNKTPSRVNKKARFSHRAGRRMNLEMSKETAPSRIRNMDLRITCMTAIPRSTTELRKLNWLLMMSTLDIKIMYQLRYAASQNNQDSLVNQSSRSPNRSTQGRLEPRHAKCKREIDSMGNKGCVT
jgi:hypothetical protein